MTANNQSNNETKLYAGKFKTIEELEAGYNNAAKVYQENEDLKTKYTEVTKIPDDYQVPADVALHENDLASLKASAKESGLTQEQFDKLALSHNNSVKAKVEAFENSKKEVGSDTINLLQDFISKTYPEKFADRMLKEAIKDKDFRSQLLEQRTRLLNSSVPGSNKVSMSNYNTVTHEDAMKAREVMMKSRGKARVEAQKRYISMASQLAHSNDS